MFRSNIEHFSLGAENSHSYNGAARSFFIGQNIPLLTFWVQTWWRRACCFPWLVFLQGGFSEVCLELCWEERGAGARWSGTPTLCLSSVSSICTGCLGLCNRFAKQEATCFVFFKNQRVFVLQEQIKKNIVINSFPWVLIFRMPLWIKWPPSDYLIYTARWDYTKGHPMTIWHTHLGMYEALCIFSA